MTGGPLRVLAAVGGTTIGGDEPANDGDLQPVVTPTRIALPIHSGEQRQGLVELSTVAHQPLGPDAARIAQTGAECLALWLAGAVRSLSFAGLVPAEAPSGGFEGRIAQELERARRFDLEVGLLVIDTDPSFATRHALVLEPILAAVRSQLRGSDLLGRLGDGAVAALLVQTGAGGVNAAAARVEQQLAWLAADGRVPHPTVGRAAYPVAAESVHALVAAAHEDWRRRATAMKHELQG
jgi:hypothetical protein